MAAYTSSATDPTALSAAETVTIDQGAVITITNGSWAAAGFGSITITWGELVFQNTSTSTGYIVPQSAFNADFIKVGGLGKLSVAGDWISIGTGTGAASQTATHWDTTGEFCPCVWIETSSGSGVYEKYLNLTGFQVSHTVTMSHVGAGDYGRFFTQSGNTLTFGDGTNGKCPPSGANIRVPNIIFTYSGTMSATTSKIGFASTYGEVALDTLQMARICISQGNWQGFTATRTAVPGGVVSVSMSAMTLTDCGLAPFRTEAVTLVDCGDSYPVDKYFRLINCDGWMSSASVACVDLGTRCNEVTLTNTRLWNIRTSTSWAGLGLNSDQSTSNLYMTDCMLASRINLGGRFNITNLIHTDSLPLVEDNTSSTNYMLTFNTCDTGVIDGYTVPSGGGSYTQLVRLANDALDLTLTNFDIQSTNNFSHGIYFQGGVHKSLKISNFSSNAFRTSFFGGSAVPAGGYFINVKSSTIDTSMTNFPFTSTALRKVYAGAAFFDPDAVFRYDIGIIDGRDSTTTGFLKALCYPQTDGTTITKSANVKFNSTGRAYFPVLSDYLILETDYTVYGVSSFQNVAPTINGASTTNLDFEYAINTGAGYGSWTTLSAANLSAESVSATTGFKIKFRATANTSSTATYLTDIAVYTNTNDAVDYPVSFVSIELSNVVVGSRYEVSRVTSGEVLATGSAADTTVTISNVVYNGEENIRVRLRKSSATTKYLPFETQAVLTANGADVYVSQIQDTIAA